MKKTKKNNDFNEIRIKLKDRFINYIKRAYTLVMTPEMGILPGQLAFFMLLSSVPIITLAGYAAGILGLNIDSVSELITKYVPTGADYLIPYFSGDSIDFKLAIMFIWMFYLASNGFNSIILASNQIYGLKANSWIHRRIKAVLMTIAMVLILLTILIIPVFGDKIIGLLKFMSIYKYIYTVYEWLKTPLIWILIFFFVRTIYEVAPDRIKKNSHINTGAAFTCIAWILITELYKFLSANIASYNFFYGTLSSIALLMLWIYFISYAFVIGLIFNHGREVTNETIDKTGAFKVIDGH